MLIEALLFGMFKPDEVKDVHVLAQVTPVNIMAVQVQMVGTYFP